MAAKLPLVHMVSLCTLVVLFGSVFVAPVSAAEPVTFPATSDYNDKQVTLEADLYRPEGTGPFPAVILMHGCGGWQPAVKRALHTHAEYLVENGFVVLNLDSFGPRGNADGWVCAKIPRLAEAQVYRAHDAFDAMKYLREQNFIHRDNIFLMGQSNGGSVAIHVAKALGHKLFGGDVYGTKAPSFRAVAAYYPWCGAFAFYGREIELISSLIVFGGAKDDWVPPGSCKRVMTSGADYTVHIYPNAAHSFDLEIKVQKYLGHLVGYDKQATDASRREMVAFFRAHMTGDAK